MNPASVPDDLRSAGWAVAVHNDYRLNGVSMTFWLFTKGERAVKGEGKTDAEALNEVRNRLGLPIPGVIAEPECPGPDCPLCSGEACDLCGAGLNVDPNRPPCDHDVIERHKIRI